MAPVIGWLLGPLALPGCVGIQYRAGYSSEVEHEPLPLRATVNVLIAPELRKERDEEEERAVLEQVRASLQRALEADLRQNGPLFPVASEPEARLVLVIEKLDSELTRLWLMMWFLAPLWLFAVPMHKMHTALGVRAELTSWQGEPLFRLNTRAGCTRHQGLYYGYQDLSFGCPARKIGERLRERISLDRARILARVERRAAPAKPATTSAAPRPVAAVFAIRDMADKTDPRLLEQLTEYLSTQLAQQLGFKVVPREQLRQRLRAAKTESYKACYDRSCQIELGRALAANKSVATTLIRVGDRCVFNISVIDLKSEAAERAASAQTRCDDESLLDGITQAVQKLRGGT
jgi:TolB-like protein